MNVCRNSFVLLALAASAASAFAFETSFAEIEIVSVAIIGGRIGQHQPGNMEVRVKWPGSSTRQLTFPCDALHFTTLRSADPDRAMMNLLVKAQQDNKGYTVTISDAPSLTAHPGRCSIVAVSLFSAPRLR